jgi:hypothetical protein
MKNTPTYIREFLSTGQMGHFKPFQDVPTLVAFWPMLGRRRWAERCLLWLDNYLATQPTSVDAFYLIHEGWHDSMLLENSIEYVDLLKGLRERLSRELPIWQDCDNYFDREKSENS